MPDESLEAGFYKNKKNDADELNQLKKRTDVDTHSVLKMTVFHEAAFCGKAETCLNKWLKEGKLMRVRNKSEFADDINNFKNRKS